MKWEENEGVDGKYQMEDKKLGKVRLGFSLCEESCIFKSLLVVLLLWQQVVGLLQVLLWLVVSFRLELRM